MKTIQKEALGELLYEISQIHTYWKNRTKKLKWWKSETGHNENIRRLCKIPLSHPNSIIQISYIYLLHLEYISSRTVYRSVKKKVSTYRKQVLENLELQLSEYGIQIDTNSRFPWSPLLHNTRQ